MNYSDKKRVDKIGKENAALGAKVNELTEIINKISDKMPSDSEKDLIIDNLKKEIENLEKANKVSNDEFLVTKEDLVKTVAELQRINKLYDKTRRKASKTKAVKRGPRSRTKE